jgi:hypothetical protein
MNRSQQLGLRLASVFACGVVLRTAFANGLSMRSAAWAQSAPPPGTLDLRTNGDTLSLIHI